MHELTRTYLDGITVEELARVVDTRWDPPVTVSVRLVSVIGDALQHLGQAAYVARPRRAPGQRVAPIQARRTDSGSHYSDDP